MHRVPAHAYMRRLRLSNCSGFWLRVKWKWKAAAGASPLLRPSIKAAALCPPLRLLFHWCFAQELITCHMKDGREINYRMFHVFFFFWTKFIICSWLQKHGVSICAGVWSAFHPAAVSELLAGISKALLSCNYMSSCDMRASAQKDAGKEKRGTKLKSFRGKKTQLDSSRSVKKNHVKLFMFPPWRQWRRRRRRQPEAFSFQAQHEHIHVSQSGHPSPNAASLLPEMTMSWLEFGDPTVPKSRPYMEYSSQDEDDKLYTVYWFIYCIRPHTLKFFCCISSLPGHCEYSLLGTHKAFFLSLFLISSLLAEFHTNM